MPLLTPKQKIEQVRMFGGDTIEIVMIGDPLNERVGVFWLDFKS